EPGGDAVDLLARVRGARGGVVVRAIQGNDLRAGAEGIEFGVVRRDVDVEAFGGRRGNGQVKVMVDELAPGVNERGHHAVVGGSVRGLIGENVADGAGIGPGGAGRG